VGKVRCILGSSARDVRVALSGVLYEVLRSEFRELLVSIFVNRLLTAKYQSNNMQKAEPGWLE